MHWQNVFGSGSHMHTSQDTPVALTTASMYFLMLPAPPGGSHSALRLVIAPGLDSLSRSGYGSESNWSQIGCPGRQ